ncbi:hypothetical protein HALDL1_10025 [Halobacterium sp. DL1]|jgi:cell shape-determining protein MreC|nr:hypothetical protein HALDL1_10025 [Halobacterium sp. DL1]
MDSNVTITEDEKGKKVVNEHGDAIGRVVEVQNGTAQVDPDPDITDTIMSKIGWSSDDGGTYALEPQAVDRITDDEIRLDLQ